MSPEDQEELDDLERKLAVEDILLYRSLATTQLKKERALRGRYDCCSRGRCVNSSTEHSQNGEERTTSTANVDGVGCELYYRTRSPAGMMIKPTSCATPSRSLILRCRPLKNKQHYLKKKSNTCTTQSNTIPKLRWKQRISRKMCVKVLTFRLPLFFTNVSLAQAVLLDAQCQLRTGSVTLKHDPHGNAQALLSLVFEGFCAGVQQHPHSAKGSLSLGGMTLNDGTTPNSLYPTLIRAKNKKDDSASIR